MLLNLFTIFAFLKISSALDDGHEWDLAVATNGHIELLADNGTLIGIAREGFANLKALAFDNVRHRFIVSDMDEYNNDTIYAIDLTKETDDNPIIADLPDDVQGLAIDPIDDILYWTDSKNQTINYISLKDENSPSQILFAFEKAWPQGIVVDVCRRYIYWTNSNRRKPSIERAKIGSEKTEVIVDSDLYLPVGITIDYKTKRIYWADLGEGIYYRLESTNLEGKQRQLIYEGIHAEPFAIAIKNEYLYFTDLRSNGNLWRYNLKARGQPEHVRSFEDKPMGLIATKNQIRTLPECKQLEEVYERYTEPVVETFEIYKEDETLMKEMQCINGTLENGVCRCSKGYSGVFCELSLCHNYCLLGSCRLTSQGYPYCHCPRGTGGPRCEKDCDGYCMNGGRCSFFPGDPELSCSCPEGFKGSRCEESIVVDSICDFYCNQRGMNDSDQCQNYCNCNKRTVNLSNIKSQALLAQDDTLNYINYLQDPIFISLGCITLTALLGCVVLSILVVYLRRKPNPKIRRRYIVNKNSSTSMTERPHAQQCEITIENCCNMNICETPCYEPPKLQKILSSRNEDKKMLLSNMEKVEDY